MFEELNRTAFLPRNLVSTSPLVCFGFNLKTAKQSDKYLTTCAMRYVVYSYDVKDFEQFARTRSVSSIWEETVRQFREYLSITSVIQLHGNVKGILQSLQLIH